MSVITNRADSRTWQTILRRLPLRNMPSLLRPMAVAAFNRRHPQSRRRTAPSARFNSSRAGPALPPLRERSLFSPISSSDRIRFHLAPRLTAAARGQVLGAGLFCDQLNRCFDATNCIRGGSLCVQSRLACPLVAAMQYKGRTFEYRLKSALSEARFCACETKAALVPRRDGSGADQRHCCRRTNYAARANQRSE